MTRLNPKDQWEALKQRVLAAKSKQLPFAPRDPLALVLGLDRPGGEPVAVGLKPLLEHMHIISGSGGGKSTLLRHFIKMIRTHGYGFCLIDPHGSDPASPYAQTLAEMVAEGRSRHVIDLGHSAITGFDPLSAPAPGVEPTVIAYNVVHAIEQARGGNEDTRDKATLRRALLALLSALAELELTLPDLSDLLEPEDPDRLRAYVTDQLKDREVRRTFERMQKLSADPRRAKDYDIEIIGPLNRINELTLTPSLRCALQQDQRSLDFTALMDRGETLLCNLQPGRYVDAAPADMYGRLLLHALLVASQFRTETKPFFIICDEAHRVLSADIATLLPECRKRNVSVTLAHQYWFQLEENGGENVAEAVRNSTEIKVVGRIKSTLEAEQLAPDVIDLNLEQPVTASIRPTVVGYDIRQMHSTSRASHLANSQGEAVTDGSSEGAAFSNAHSSTTGKVESRSHGNVSGSGYASGMTTGNSAGHSSGSSDMSSAMATPNNALFGTPQLTGLSTGTGASDGNSSATSEAASSIRSFSEASTDTFGEASVAMESDSTSETVSRATNKAVTKSRATTAGESLTFGNSETLAPILADLPASFHGKDAATYFAAQKLRSLLPGQFCIRFRNTATTLQVPNVAPRPLSHDQLYQLTETALARSPSTTPRAEAAAHVLDRRRRLLERVAEHFAGPPVLEPGSAEPLPSADFGEPPPQPSPKRAAPLKRPPREPRKPRIVVDNDKGPDEQEVH